MKVLTLLTYLTFVWLRYFVHPYLTNGLHYRINWCHVIMKASEGFLLDLYKCSIKLFHALSTTFINARRNALYWQLKKYFSMSCGHVFWGFLSGEHFIRNISKIDTKDALGDAISTLMTAILPPILTTNLTTNLTTAILAWPRQSVFFPFFFF